MSNHVVTNQAVSEILSNSNIDAYLIPGTDPHQSEYLSDHWNFRKQLTNFAGSFGNVVLGVDKGLVTTDSRYEIQIKNEVTNDYFEQLVVNNAEGILISELRWAYEKKGSLVKVGVDPRLISVKVNDNIKQKLEGKVELHWVSSDILSSLWDNRPSESKDNVFSREEYLDSHNSSEKIKKIQDQLKKEDLNCHIISDLESIARTLNLRGTDISPDLMFVSYLIVTNDSVYLFVDKDKLSNLDMNTLCPAVEIKDYTSFAESIPSLTEGKKTLVDPQETNMLIFESLHPSAEVQLGKSPCNEIKKIKTPKELEFSKEAHKLDAVALTNAYAWLVNEVKERKVTEYEVGEKLLEFRQKLDGFIQHSFDPIVGYMANGAIVHYRADKDTSASLKPEGIVLIDSGGHYNKGTTDVTRVISLGNVTDEMRARYTDVLKGHVGINLIKFKKNLSPMHLDIIARAPLYMQGLDYGHGTGHAVGYCTAVHESTDAGLSYGRKERFTEGAIISNEPGYYKEGEFGIRIENLVSVKDQGEFFYFDQLTILPYDRDLIDKDLLNKEEIDWINNYHQFVLKSLSDLVDESARPWLEKNCMPI